MLKYIPKALLCAFHSFILVHWNRNNVFLFPRLPLGYVWSQDSSVGIAMSYKLDGRGSIAGRGQDFSLLHSVQTDSGAYPAYLMGTGGKAAGA
jgi:hypothetical protein